MKSLVYSTSYLKEISDLKSIIEDYNKTLQFIVKEGIVNLYENVFDVKNDLKLEDLRDILSRKYFNKLEILYNSGNQIIKNHIYNELLGCNGSKIASVLALKSGGISYHLGGGYHHASRFREGGFDYINDIVYLIEYLRKEENIERFLVIDLDVHFPDGTYDNYIFDSSVYQFSIHGWNLFPGRGWITDNGAGKAKFTKLNIPLPGGTTGDLYLLALNRFLEPFMKLADPEFVIYQAGCDVLYNDSIGNLRLTLKDVYERDRYVYELVHKIYRLPMVILAGGGYSEDTWKARVNTISLIAQDKIIFKEEIEIKEKIEIRKKFYKWFHEFEKYFSTKFDKKK